MKDHTEIQEDFVCVSSTIWSMHGENLQAAHRKS